MDNNILQELENFLRDNRCYEAYRRMDYLDDEEYMEAVEYLNEKDIFNVDESYKNYLMDSGIPCLGEEHKYHKIARNIETLDEESIDYDLALWLSLAYTNMGEFEHSLEILEDYSDQGQDDAVFHARLSLNYAGIDLVDETIEELEEALEIDPECMDALLHGAAIYRELGNFERSTELSKTLKELYPDVWHETLEDEFCLPILYSPEEVDCVENYICKNFGYFENILHEIVSPDIHVDLAVIPPSENKNYYILATIGMGAFAMDIDSSFDENAESRMELVLYLPPDWNINTDEEYYSWPIRELKTLARFPIVNDTWLGIGHTVTNGKPFSKYSDFNGFILSHTANSTTDKDCILPNGDHVRFCQIIPVYEGELIYKIENGAGALLRKLIDFFPFVFDPKRPNTCPKHQGKPWAIPKSCIVQLLEWQKPAGCFATDRIMVDGAAIGFMYRELPRDERDSGWRFMAGDESQNYMNDSNNMGIYHLNTLCNYAHDIMPLLDSPYGSAFRRNEDDILVPEKNFEGLKEE